MSSSLLTSTAVVTVTYNSSSQLEGFLKSVTSSETSALVCVVADNDSADVAVTRGITISHGGRLLELSENRGYGGAINAAIRTLPSDIEYVLISNPDISLGHLATSALLEVMSADPRAGSVGPRVLNSDGTTYPSGRELPSLRTGVGHAIFSHIWPQNPWSRTYRAESEGAELRREVGWLSGSCLLVRRSAFEQLDGFDENFFMYFEDVDLGFRLGKAGCKNIYTPDALVVHAGAASTNAESGKMLRAHHESAYRYLEKKYSAPYLAPIRWVLKAGLRLRAHLFTRSG